MVDLAKTSKKTTLLKDRLFNFLAMLPLYWLIYRTVSLWFSLGVDKSTTYELVMKDFLETRNLVYGIYITLFIFTGFMFMLNKKLVTEDKVVRLTIGVTFSTFAFVIAKLVVDIYLGVQAII